MSKSTKFSAIIAFFAFLKAIIFSFFGLNLFDYGESLHNGVRILQGEVLYKDIWAFFPPADNYLPAIVLALTNQHLLAYRFVQSFIFGLLIFVVFKLVESFLNKRFAFILAVALIFSNLNVHLLFFQFFFFSALYFAIRSIALREYLWIFVSGIFIGVGTLFRHDTGLFASISIIIFLVISAFLRGKKKTNLKTIAIFVSGIVLVVTPVLILLSKQETLGNFLYMSFVKAPKISTILSPGFDIVSSLRPPLTQLVILNAFTIYSYVLYLLVYLFTFLYLYRNYKKKRSTTRYTIVLVLAIYGALQLLYAFSILDLGHLVKAGIPAIILGVYLVQEAVSNKIIGRLSLLLSLPLLIWILGNLAMSFWWLSFNDTRVNFKQGTVFINSEYIQNTTRPSAETLSRSVSFIEQNTVEDEYIFVAPYHAILYFLTERKSPTKFNNFAAGFVSEYEQQMVVDDIEDKKVNVVVYDAVNSPHRRKFSEYNSEIHNYLMEEFTVVETTPEGWLFMKRK